MSSDSITMYSSLNKDKNDSSNYDQITNIYNSIIYYYNFERKILNDLKNKQSSKDIEFAFLISKNWIDKWKEITCYENIKNHYIQKNINNKNDIINGLIYYLEKIILIINYYLRQ